MTPLHLPSPAKLNLFLHVTGRRKDGYHWLQTAFQFIDFCDDLFFSLRDDACIHIDAGSLDVPVQDNLIFRAASLLQTLCDCKKGIDITLVKRIPVGGGLGGGSSNAATTLLALNKLWEINLSPQELAILGLQLGADVPIFLHGRASFAQGIGEQLQTVHFPEPWFLVLIPPCQVLTAKIFSDSQLTRNTQPITITKFLYQGGRNDCEFVARKHYPEIARALDWLSQYASAKMTGTGSCVFASFESSEAALKVAKKIPTFLKGIVAKGQNRSPLHIAINNF